MPSTYYCPECKKELNKMEQCCPYCGYPIMAINKQIRKKAWASEKKHILIALFLGLLLLSIILPLIFGSNSKKSSSYSSYSSSYSYTTRYYEYAPLVLKTSNIRVKSEYSYTTVDGTLTNNGRYTYRFVKVKGAFKNYRGDIVDTDWTYAVGSEGLEPGESTTFHMSVPKNTSISSCDVSIYDYS